MKVKFNVVLPENYTIEDLKFALGNIKNEYETVLESEFSIGTENGWIIKIPSGTSVSAIQMVISPIATFVKVDAQYSWTRSMELSYELPNAEEV